MKKLIIIGDSFALGFTDLKYCNLDSDYLIKPFKDLGYEIHIDGQPSRDVQTIIDTWIKYLPLVNENDVFIILLPFFGRTRLPLSNVIKKGDEFKIPNYFIGTKSYHKNIKLDFWSNDFEPEYFYKKMEMQEMINSSYSSKKNYLEIIDSLYKITKSKKIILSWVNIEIDNDFIFDKNKITEQIGFWETLGDQYKKTNGQQGVENDLHWSVDMYKKIIEFIKNNLNL